MVGGVEGGGGLRRRDVPPAGVQTTVGASLLPTDSCAPPEPPPSSPRLTYSDGAPIDSSRPFASIGTPPGLYTLVCASGFGPGSVSFQVRLPDGRVRRFPPGDSLEFALAVLDPVGTYVISATQGSKQAGVSVIVTLPRAPVVDTQSPASAPAGSTFSFGVATPGPNQAVDLDVYVYPTGQQYGNYLTTLIPARTGGSGQVVYRLPTRGDDPAGKYSVNVRGDGGVGAPFTVT